MEYKLYKCLKMYSGCCGIKKDLSRLQASFLSLKCFLPFSFHSEIVINALWKRITHKMRDKGIDVVRETLDVSRIKEEL